MSIGRWGGAALVALVLVGCTNVGDLARNKTREDGPSGNPTVEAASADFPVAHLRARTVNAARVTTFNYCGGLDVVDCAVLPLVSPAQNQCAVGVENPPVSLACRPLKGDEGLLLGWRVQRRAGGGRALSIHRGDAGQGLAEVFGADDANGGWSSVHVCTADISADGRTDVTIEYRSASVPGKVMVEVVDLSVLPPRAPLVAVEPLEVPDAREGQGCVTTGLLNADFQNRKLEVDDPPASPPSSS